MIIVIVTVDEPGNPEAGTKAEAVITGVFHGFEDEADAMGWCERMKVKWKVPQDGRTNFSITESRPSSSVS